MTGLLLIGYGNPGRGDDGLGPALARRIVAHALPGVTVDIDYQLSVDHALAVSAAATVIFADAALDATDPFYLRPVTDDATTLGSHAVTPSAVLSLARLLFDARPAAFVLGLRGASYGQIAEGLSPTAEESLTQAEAFLLRWIATHPSA